MAYLEYYAKNKDAAARYFKKVWGVRHVKLSTLRQIKGTSLAKKAKPGYKLYRVDQRY